MTELPGVAVGADINAEFLLALGGIKQQLQYLRKENHEAKRQAEYARLKNYLPLTGNVVLTAGGAGFVDLGTPALGRVWTIRMLAAATQGGELAAASVVNLAWYIGVNIPGAAAGTSLQFTSQWRESTNSVPFMRTYTSDIHQLRAGEHLFAIAAGGTGSANANMVFNAVVLDEPMKVGIPIEAQG